jgi:hypothetical protein
MLMILGSLKYILYQYNGGHCLVSDIFDMHKILEIDSPSILKWLIAFILRDLFLF